MIAIRLVRVDQADKILNKGYNKYWKRDGKEYLEVIIVYRASIQIAIYGQFERSIFLYRDPLAISIWIFNGERYRSVDISAGLRKQKVLALKYGLLKAKTEIYVSIAYSKWYIDKCSHSWRLFLVSALRELLQIHEIK